MTENNLLGQQVQGYTITQKLGSGGYGTVYLGTKEDRGGQYRAAIKHISMPDADAYDAVMQDYNYDKTATQAHFEKLVAGITAEINTLLNLSKKDNRYIVAYYDHDIQKSLDPLRFDIFMRMEYLTPLNKSIRQRGMTMVEVIKLGLNMCDALSLCHSSDIMHRDIKEANIFVSDDGNYKLGDFGVSKAALETTQAGSMKGTASYMAPEIYLREAYDKSVDIYSLGIVLYKLLNNQRLPFMPDAPAPFTADDKNAAESKRIRGETPPIPYNAKRRLGEIIIKACSLKTQRYKTADEFRADLEAYNRSLSESEANSIVIPPSADSEEAPTPMTERVFLDAARNTITSQQETQDNSMQVEAEDKLRSNSSEPTIQQNPYVDAKVSSGSSINKKLIAIVSSIAGVIVVGAIMMVIFVVSNNSNDDTPVTINQASSSVTAESKSTAVPTEKPTPKSTTEPTPEPTPEQVQINYNPLQYFEMSENLLDYTLNFDGDVFQLPMTLDVFLSYGWETDTDLSGTLVSGQYHWYYFTRGNKEATVYMANMSDEPRHISRATVYSLKMNAYWDYMGDSHVEIELPMGIKTGSSKEDVIAAFGEPTSTIEFTTDDDEDYADLSYFNKATDTTAYYRGVKIQIRNGFVAEIIVSNMAQLPSDLISDAVEVSSVITEKEKNYKIPAELGSDLASFNIEIDGDLYTLPTPLTAFLNNGWEIQEGETNMLSERTSFGIHLVKDNFQLSHINVTNFSDSLMYIQNCFVVSVSSLQYVSDKVTFTLPGGIAIGTSESDLFALFGNVLEKKYYSGYESWYYEFTPGRNMGTIEISIDKDTKLVKQIDMNNKE
jgi:serine/threonine protein kinase